MESQILIVDDCDAIRECMADVLKTRGYEVTTAVDGQDALAKFDLLKPDLLVIDLTMPRMDGLELCRRLRGISSVPIIIVTGQLSGEESVKAFEAGADACLSKPFDLGEFTSQVRRLLNLKFEATNSCS